MVMLKGIDISEHNGEINWAKTSRKVDFAIIRLGYGPANHADEKAQYNLQMCEKYGVKYGAYWFSYAANPDEAIIEANNAISQLNGLIPDYPIAFDFEYDSDSYLERNRALKLSNNARANIAKAFCNQIKARGYEAMLYTNYDYYAHKGFSLVKDVPLWFAYWGDEQPPVPWYIWQTTSTGYIDGISGNVDLNYIDTKYATSKKSVDDILKSFKDKYIKIANDIIAGKYGNGADRIEAMRKLGVDYDIAQAFVNNILGY